MEEENTQHVVHHKKNLKARLSGMTAKKQVLVVATIAVLLMAALFLGYKYTQAQKDVERLKDPQVAARDEAQRITTAVSELVELPTGETPTLATVTDVSKLKKQAFFAKARNGDKVLIYTQAKLAVLYRPATSKVINIAPLNIGTGTNTNNNNSSSPSDDTLAE